MKSSSASYSKKKKWLIGALTPVMAVCLAMGMMFMSATDGQRTAYAATGFNNIVNANIGMHPKWIESECITARAGGVGDTYTNKHDVWHADVTTKEQDGVGNDVVMEKSPSYVFTGNEKNADGLAKTYSLKAGNEVVFNITDGDSAAKVWADAVAFAQTLGEATPLADWSLAGGDENGSKANSAHPSACTGTGTENHNGFRVGTNTGVRNMYKGNFFIQNTDEEGNQTSLGQYIIVRLQDDWTAKSITTTAPTVVTGPATASNLTGANLNGESDYLVGVSGTSSAVTTTSFNYVTNEGNNTPNVFGEGLTYLPTATSGYTRIDNNTGDGSNYVISWDLASNSCDYDGQASGVYGYIYNDTCAFSYGRINVPTGVYIVLDLNGHTINRNLTTANYYGSVFHIDSKARLEIMDSSAYENASAARIEGGEATTGIGGTPHTTNHKGTITGGKVSSSTKLSLPQTLQANLQSNGGGFNLSMWADVVLHSGTISNNQNGSSSGGAFYQRSKAAVTIFDGYVLDNEAVSGGVTNLGSGSGCPFTMYGGVLAYNKATNGTGGAVNLAESSYGNFHGGEIMYNEAAATGNTRVTYGSNKPSYYGVGGAICLAGNTLGILDSVTIAHNKAASSGTVTVSNHEYSYGGGGVFVGPAVGAVDKVWKNGDNAFKFRGSLQIHDNTAGSQTDNVHLGYGFVGSGFLPGLVGDTLGQNYEGFPKIGIGGPLIANGIVANVGVTLGKSNASQGSVFTSGYGAKGNSGVNTFLYFHSDSATYSVVNAAVSGNREATLGNQTSANTGLTWLVEGTGTDADTDINKGESTLKIVISSSGSTTFYYKNPNESAHVRSLKQVDANDTMSKEITLNSGAKTNKLLEILQDKFTFASGSLTFEYSMLKVTRIAAYDSTTTFSVAGDALNATTTALAEWKSVPAGSDKQYTITNSFDAANFRFKMGTEDLTATKNAVTPKMQNAISATDGSISYAGEYSVLVSGARYDNPSFKIKINQVGVEVGRTLYYNGKNIETELGWIKDIDWDGSKSIGGSGSPQATLGNEKNQPYFIYTGAYYYPILNADYNRLDIFNLRDPFTGQYSKVAKNAFTGYVLEFTYANEYFGTNQPVQFGSHSGGGIEYQTMHRKPGAIQGIGTYVSGVKNAGMYSVQFISSRSAQSADEGDADYKATGVYFAANNFAFSSKINIYVDPASAEVELTDEAKAGFTYDAGALKDEEIVIYDNTSNTHVNPHLDNAAVLEYYLFDDLQFKAGIYDVRTKLYYTLDQIVDWENIRPLGWLDAHDDSAQKAKAEKEGRPYFPSYPDSQLEKAPVVLWDSKTGEKFDPAKSDNGFTSGILTAEGLKAFQKLYEKPTDRTSNGKLVYIVDQSSFALTGGAKKLEGKPTDARRYAVFIALDLDAGYEDYNYVFDQNADHLVGLDDGTGYFWAFEFTVNPAVVRPYDFDAEDKPTGIPGEGDKNTSVTVQREVGFNGLGQFQLPTLTYTDALGVPRTLTGSAAKSKKGEIITFAEKTLYAGSEFITRESGYDFIVKYYIAEYELGETLDYVNVMGGKKLKVRIYIPSYKDENGVLTGANGNYTFDGDALGSSSKDEEGYYYEIEYEITPVTVTTSLTVTYTYDGTTREEDYKPSLYNKDTKSPAEQDGNVGQGVGGVWATERPALAADRQQGFIYPFSMVKDSGSDTAHGTEVGPVVGKDKLNKDKLKYTISNPVWVFSNQEYQKNTNISFGSGVYTFNTGNPNVGQYVLNTATQLKDGGGDIKTQHNTAKLDIDAGVVWVFAFSNANDYGHTYSRQGLNGTADEDGNYGNFVVGADSHVTVIIVAKYITDDNVFATKIQQSKNGDALPESATEHGALTIDENGYADVAYKADGGAVVQDTAAELDGTYKMATFPFAGTSNYYRPLVKMNYYKYGVNGTTAADARGTDVVKMEQDTDFTLTWADNSMISVTSDAEKISAGDADGSFASVIVNARGNYTGSITVNFYIRPAVIAIAHTGGAYDFTKGAEPEYAEYNGYYYDRNSHGIQLTYTNTEDYTPYKGMLYNARGGRLADVAGLKTSTNINISQVAYAYASQELFDAFHKKYFEDNKVTDGGLTDLNKLYSVDQPVEADVYYVAIALSDENFVFKQAKEGEEFPSITGSNFGNGTNDLVRGTFEIKPATVTASLDGTGSEFYNRSAHTASFNFTNDRAGKGETATPSLALNEYTVAYQCGKATEMVDAGTYTVTVTFETHKWLCEGNIDEGMKSGIEMPKTTRSNFVFHLNGEKERTFEFTIKPAEIKLDKFADATYNKKGQPVTLGFYNTERNNDAVPTLAAAAEGDPVTADEYTLTYTPDPETTNAKLADGSNLPLNAGKYTVTVALTDDAKSKADTTLYNFKFIAGDGQTVNDDGKMEIVSPYTITPAIVNASVAEQQFIYDGIKHQQEVQFENAYDEDSIVPASGTDEYSVEYKYDGFSKQEKGAFTDRGSYSITVTLKQNGNYTFGKRGTTYNYTNKLSYSIQPKSIADEDVTLSETPSEIVYTGESLTPDFTLTATKILGGYALKADEDYYVTHGRDVEVYYDAATAQTVVTVTITGQNNFGGKKTFSFTIIPAEVSVTANDATAPGETITLPYNKFSQSLDFVFANGTNPGVVPTFGRNAGFSYYTVTYKNQDPSDDETYTQQNAPVNAGTYTVTVTLGKNDKGNYTFEDSSHTKTFTLTITPAELTLTIAETFAKDGAFVKSFVYDGQDYYNRLNGFRLDNENKIVPVSSDVTEAFYLGEYSKGELQANFMNVGDYYILFTFTGELNVNKNYTVTKICAGSVTLAFGSDYTAQDGSIVIPFEITPAQITVNALSNKTYTGENITADIRFTNKVSGGVTPEKYTATYSGGTSGGNYVKDAGTYTVEVALSGDDATNFEIVVGTETRQFTVDPAIISASVKEQQFTYDGAVHQQTVQFANTLGEGAVTPTQAEGVEYTLTYAYEGTSAQENGGFKDRGFYRISVDLTEGGNFAFGKDESGAYNYHYDISYSILPKPITREEVTGIEDNEHKTYTGASLTPTVTIRTTLETGAYTLTENDYSISNTPDVDAYTVRGVQNQVTVTISGQNNFSGTLVYHFFIDPAKVSVTANDGTNPEETEPDGTVKVKYNKYQQALTFDFTNSVNEDVVPTFNANVNFTNYTVAYKNQDGSDPTEYTQMRAPTDAGTYTVTVTLKSTGNFTFEDGTLIKTFTLVIEKAQLDLTISELFANGSVYVNKFVYDGKDYYNRLNSFDLDNTNGTVPVGSEVTKQFYLGIYPAEEGGALTKFSDAGNYYILFAFKSEEIGKNYEVAAVYAGSSAVVLQIGDDHDYTVKDDGSIVIPFKIMPAQITVNALSNKTYTGGNITAEISFTNQSEANGIVPTDYTVDYGDKKDHVVNAGEYTVTVTLQGTDANNFKIVAWDSAGTATRQFTVDPAKLTVSLGESVVDYTGENHTVQANFTNTSETKVVPETIGGDYSLTLATTDGTDAPAYNAVIDAKTYQVTVALLSHNFEFAEGGETMTLTYIITPGTITLSSIGEEVKINWEQHTSYNPSNPIRTQFPSTYFNFVGKRQTDIDGMSITLVSCTEKNGETIQPTDGYYEITGKGTYTVEIQVSAPNHNPATFTFVIDVQGGNVLINVPEDFSNFITAKYGEELDENALKNAFLDLIKADDLLTVENIPDEGLTGIKSGESVVAWLVEFGFTVTVNGGTNSTSGHLRVGSYALTVSLPGVDGGIWFHDADGSQVTTSHTLFYKIEPRVISIGWGALDALKYSGKDQSGAIKNGVRISNLLEGDKVYFDPTYISIGTKNPGFVALQNVTNAVQAGTEDLIQYYLRLLANEELTLDGADKDNYVFSESGRVDEDYFEQAFTIARLELNILLTNSESYYGNDYTENFTFTHSDISGSASVDVDEAMLREAVLAALKLYFADKPVSEQSPGVNTYTVKADAGSKDFGNLKLEFTNAATHEIKPRPVTLQMASSSSIYGETVVLPDKDSSWDYAPGSLHVLDDDLKNIQDAITILTDATSASPVIGSYRTYGELISNDTAKNYTIAFADGVYTITPRPIIINIKDRESVYGEAVDNNLTGDDAWSVDTHTNYNEESGALNYGLRDGETDPLGIVLSLNLVYTTTPLCNRTEDGSIIPWANVITGVCSNSNYTVTAWKNGNYMVQPRKVTIVISDREAIYGDALASVGTRLTLAEPIMNADSTEVIKPGDWTYADTLGHGTYAILPVDISYLAFYVGRASSGSESAFAYVGKYPLVGAWAFGLEKESVSYCYEITFTGAWDPSFNSDFGEVKEHGAGVYEINPASITKEGNWNVNKFFYETSNPEKTEDNGWFKMFLEQMLFSLRGDFNAALSGITFADFTYSGENSVPNNKMAFTVTLRINGKDETLTLTFAKPEYSGIGLPTGEEPYYNAADHLWYVHTSGKWTSQVTVSVANHTDATFALTYTIANVVATVTLNDSIGALQAVYGDYRYLALAPGRENYNENDIKDLPLSEALNKYIFDNSSMIITVTGFEAAFPEWVLADQIRAIVENCWVEVADAKISSGGYLTAGYYTLRLVAREGSGFIVNFKASSTTLSEGEVDQGAGNRLFIRPREIGIDWVDPDTAKSDEIILEGSDKITYTYSGYEYSQQPTFTGILPGDLVQDPVYQFLIETGTTAETAKDVRRNGYYTIKVLQSAIEGADSANYRLPADMTIRLDIIPREIYITIDDLESTVYGVEPDLGRTFTTDDWHVATGKGLGLAAGETADDLNVELHIELPSKNAALYANAVKGEGNNGNYEFHFEGGNYEITPKSIHITIEDKKSFYGDDLAALGFTVDDDALAYEDTPDDLLVALTKDDGLDVGDYAITGVSTNPNYVVTFTDGTYTIEQATNVWLREFQAFEFLEGENPPEDQQPLARFGDVHLYYFYDEACTEEVTVDDLSELEDGVYYVRAVVDGTENYTPLNDLYTFTILPTFSTFGNNLDIGIYVTIWTIQVVALLGAVLFIRRRKQKNGTKKS